MNKYVVLVKILRMKNSTSWVAKEGLHDNEEIARIAARDYAESEPNTFVVAKILDVGYRKAAPVIMEVEV